MAAAARHGARIMIDATQAVPFVPLAGVIDRIDYIVVAGYKHLLSPRGTAYLYVRRDHWDELEPRNANWRAADRPYVRYFGGPLTLARDARRFDVSRGWFAWIGATESLRLLAEWQSTGAFEAVRGMAEGLAGRLGVPWYGGSLVCAQLDDGEAARAACAEAGVKASVRGTAVRFSVHVYNTEADLDRAAKAIAPFTGG
jgi:selenocysteine lyase/cysteine desulfurase